MTLVTAFFMVAFLFSGCTKGKTTKFTKPDIKDDFCGVVMNFQYCKCAFHNEYCDTVSLSSGDANSYVQDEYNKWIKELKDKFGTECEMAGGIYNGNDKCTYCEDPYVKENNKCVKQKEGDQDQDSEASAFRPDGPFNSDCSINEEIFANDWRKYSDFDNAIQFDQRSWEAQQTLGVYEQILDLRAQNFVLERDMEVDRQLRLAMREYKTALVQNIKTNLLKSFWRLSYITYSTIKSGKGVGESYSKVLTSGQTIERISQGLKVVQAVIPADSSLAIDTSSASGKVKSIGLNAALEAFDSLGDPIKIATQVVNDSANAVLPSADITPEEVEILRTQHLTNKAIDEALKASYKANAERRKQLLENERKLQVLEAEAFSWETKEKIRVRSMLEADCQRQKDDFENQETSWINHFVKIAQAQEAEQVEQYSFGKYIVEYDSKQENDDNSVDYYLGEDLVLSVYDTDDNGQDDLWLQYDEELYLIVEAQDTTGDANPDTIAELDKDENVISLVEPEVKIPDEYLQAEDSQRIAKQYGDKVLAEDDGLSKAKSFMGVLILLIVLAIAYIKVRQSKK